MLLLTCVLEQGCGSPILYLQHLAGCLAQRRALSGVIGQLPTHPRLALCLHQEGFLASGFWIDSTPGVHWPEMGGKKGRGGAEIRAPSSPALVWQQLRPSAEATQAASPLAAALTNDHSLLLLCRPRVKAPSDASLTSIRALAGPTHTLFAKSGVNEFSHAE